MQLYSQVRPNERPQTSVFLVNEKEERGLGTRRTAIRRKSSSGSRHARTTTNSEDYIEIGDITSESLNKASEKTIRFESSSLKTTSNRKDSASSNSHRRRSSKFRVN